jgi:membrane-bound metal-dependent hydrolase YbcI (DUF457 family)
MAHKGYLARMDVFSHGLWGGIAVGRRSKKSFWTAVAFGVAPDVIAFGPFLVVRLLDQGTEFFSRLGQRPDIHSIPDYVHTVYSTTHSLVVFAFVFAIVWAIRRKPIVEMLAWGLHICMDIPTHSDRFFPTPFLWPLSDYHINGIPWSNPYIFFPEWGLLFILYGWFFYRKSRAAKRP